MKTRALLVSTVLANQLLVGNALGQTNVSPQPDAASAERMNAMDSRIDELQARIDRLLSIVEKQAADAAEPSEDPAPQADANATGIQPQSTLAPEETLPPVDASATSLKPGWVVRTYPLDRFTLERTGDVLSAFVLPASTFHLDAHVSHSLFPQSTRVAYELTGFMKVAEAGEHSLGILIDEAQNGRCGSRATIENQVVFEDDDISREAKAFDPLIGTAKLEPGLYEVRVWIGCFTSTSKPSRVRLISRQPSMTAPDVIPDEVIGHREL